jgi:hypothetical protein
MAHTDALIQEAAVSQILDTVPRFGNPLLAKKKKKKSSLGGLYNATPNPL